MPLRLVLRAWRLAFRRSRPTKSARALAAGPRAATRARKGGGSGDATRAALALRALESGSLAQIETKKLRKAIATR
eukprot:3286225-Pleurochrysis_carterae.AAC.1